MSDDEYFNVNKCWNDCHRHDKIRCTECGTLWEVVKHGKSKCD